MVEGRCLIRTSAALNVWAQIVRLGYNIYTLIPTGIRMTRGFYLNPYLLSASTTSMIFSKMSGIADVTLLQFGISGEPLGFSIN